MHCVSQKWHVTDCLPSPLPEYGSGAHSLPPWPVVTVCDPALTPSCPLRVTSAHRPDWALPVLVLTQCSGDVMCYYCNVTSPLRVTRLWCVTCDTETMAATGLPGTRASGRFINKCHRSSHLSLDRGHSGSQQISILNIHTRTEERSWSGIERSIPWHNSMKNKICPIVLW